MNREDVMRDCPEEFVDILKEFIDYVEDEVKGIRDNLDIRCIWQIGYVEDAFDKAEELAASLH